jgi:hypothetical protein
MISSSWISTNRARARRPVNRRFGKQDFVYVAADDVYLCLVGKQLIYHYTNEEGGKTLRRYWMRARAAR